MNRTYRIAALVIVLALAASAAVIRRPDDGAPPAAPTITASLPQESAAASQESGRVPEGETAAQAAQYTADQNLATMPPQWAAIFLHQRATKGPEQPIPFNHRFHSGELQIDCMYCHKGTERSVSGVVPAMEVCMGCHLFAGTGLPPIEQLRQMWANRQPIEWKWVNKLPEFVQFNHRPHMRNDVTCQDCHGPVEEMDRVYQWAPLTMGWCLECHRSAPSDADVATDHLLSATVQLLPGADEPEPSSYYPRAIDSQYGKFRGPTDCATCHY